MRGTFKIAASLLKDKHAVPYKYLVYSPKQAEDNDPYEYLHDFPSIVNRALVLGPEQFATFYGGLLLFMYICVCTL